MSYRKRFDQLTAQLNASEASFDSARSSGGPDMSIAIRTAATGLTETLSSISADLAEVTWPGPAAGGAAVVIEDLQTVHQSLTQIGTSGSVIVPGLPAAEARTRTDEKAMRQELVGTRHHHDDQ
jgi:hypothetical protein